MTGHMCPECGREQGARPGAGCACGARTADRDARSAEIAAAEDFDPLRIRPYVTLSSDDDTADPYVTPGGGRDTGGTYAAPESGHDTGGAYAAPGGGSGAAYATTGDDDTRGMRLTPGGGAGEHDAPGPEAAATTMPLFLDGVRGGALDGTAGGAAGAGRGPGPGLPPDASAVDEARRRTAAAYAGSGPDPVQPRRRRPFAVVAVGAAVAAVVGTAAFASGLFDDEDRREAALPEVTSSVPDTGGEPAASVSESPSASPLATPSRSASASPSASPSPSKSPSASRSATASASSSPSASATKAPATTAAAPPAEEASGTTLRRGDRGAEVSELQRRLQEIWVYRGPDDGDYSERVEQAVAEYQRWVSVQGDPSGVYGPETRHALEAQTSGRGRRS
ncbi:peptidoglycan-binding protein [Streptomyces sp. ADI93-02]|uniref:peptidoglycan-binding protein n=1 Tax=Streptomyces sp. ADI93-02 TaxID=1522757 RepID=UPI000F553E31|nr:peptidoglycan-binding protein [Streptomyces sp. ADI93-02]RPK43066.1 putative peptidoglycan binding domain protein [Streptomyces sp. ADI93-02]